MTENLVVLPIPRVSPWAYMLDTFGVQYFYINSYPHKMEENLLP